MHRQIQHGSHGKSAFGGKSHGNLAMKALPKWWQSRAPFFGAPKPSWDVPERGRDAPDPDTRVINSSIRKLTNLVN
jgi:hypothetical protein